MPASACPRDHASKGIVALLLILIGSGGAGSLPWRQRPTHVVSRSKAADAVEKLTLGATGDHEASSSLASLVICNINSLLSAATATQTDLCTPEELQQHTRVFPCTLSPFRISKFATFAVNSR